MVSSSGWLASSPRPKSKLYLCVMSMLFADDAASATHPETAMQRPINNSAASVKTLASLNQPQENQCKHECPGCQPSLWNQNRRPHFRFNHLHMNSSFDSEISQRISKAPAPCPNWKKESLEKQIPDWEHQNVYLYLPGSTLLCGSEFGPPKWERKPLELLPFAMPRRILDRRQVARPYNQQWDTVTCWHPQTFLRWKLRESK